MIRIYKEQNPAGNYWMEFTEPQDETITRHLMSGQGWNPTLLGAAAFLRLAKVHGVNIEAPSEVSEKA